MRGIYIDVAISLTLIVLLAMSAIDVFTRVMLCVGFISMGFCWYHIGWLSGFQDGRDKEKDNVVTK